MSTALQIAADLYRGQSLLQVDCMLWRADRQSKTHVPLSPLELAEIARQQRKHQSLIAHAGFALAVMFEAANDEPNTGEAA